MDWKETLACWDALAGKEPKAVRVSLHRIGDQKALQALSRETREEFERRVAALFRESWREYFTISALWSSWDALGIKAASDDLKRLKASQSVGNPPTKIEEIRKVFQTPPDPEVPKMARAWLERNR